MDIELQDTLRSFSISASDDGKIAVNGTTLQQSKLILPDASCVAWPVASFKDLSLEALTGLVKYRPELVLLGTGSHMQPLPENWIFELLKRGIIIECMTTRSACGTYQMMLAEKRQVVLAIIVEGSLLQAQVS